MTVFIIKDGLKGLLSALYFSFTGKIIPDRVYPEDSVFQAEIDSYIIDVKTDLKNADRVQKALLKYGGADITDRILTCMSSCEDRAVTYAFDFARFTLEEGRNVSDNLSEERVARFYYTEQKVRTEYHRLKGFLRFKETAKGFLYAEYSPDNDITYMLAPHFFKRLNKLPFVIHDIRRGKIAMSDGNCILFDCISEKAGLTLSENEMELQSLWKKYYRNVNIQSRKNTRAQDNYLPRRYRKFMSETHEI